MFIPAMVTECDITGEKYEHPVKGAYALARGATGRWCPVLSFGTKALEDYTDALVSVETAREIIEAKGDWLDY
jgi:hypothetical protein